MSSLHISQNSITRYLTVALFCRDIRLYPSYKTELLKRGLWLLLLGYLLLGWGLLGFMVRW